LILFILCGIAGAAERADTIGGLSEIPGAGLHAEGAQIYECQPGSAGKLEWQAREPVATLMDGDNSVGRHYAALHWASVDPRTLVWEHKDGSSVKAKIVASAPGQTADDLPWLTLQVVTQLADGVLYGATNVQRINTRGGMAGGACNRPGAFRSVPYSADYVFQYGE